MCMSLLNRAKKQLPTVKKLQPKFTSENIYIYIYVYEKYCGAMGCVTKDRIN